MDAEPTRRDPERQLAGVLNSLRSGKISDEDWVRITGATSQLSEAKIFIDETPALNSAELAIVEWVSWFNHERLHSSIGDVPPAEFEALYVDQGDQLISPLMKIGSN